MQHSIHMNIGIQRELRGNMVLGVEFVRRNFEDTLLGSLDLNRFNRFINGVQTPVIPRCTTAAQRADPERPVLERRHHVLDAGWTRDATTRLLVKLDKRFSNRYLFGASYALTDRKTVNSIPSTHPEPRQLLRELRSDRRASPAERVGADRFARGTCSWASSRRCRAAGR